MENNSEVNDKKKLLEKVDLIYENIADVKDDAFDYASKAKLVAEIIRKNEPPFVFAVCGSWGTGKSTFLNMLAEELKSDENVLIYFNAWRASIHENTLAAFVYSIKDQLENNDILQKKFFTQNGQKALKGFMNAALDIGTLFNPVLGPFKNFINQALELRNQTMDRILKAESAIRDNFEKISEIIPEDKEIIIFIDEIDRCSPDSAIKIIESVRMLFTVEDKLKKNIERSNNYKKSRIPFKYIISMDENFITTSIKNKYELTEKDSDEYLAKFIQQRYHLVVNNWTKFIENRIKRYEKYSKLYFKEKYSNTFKNINEILSYFKVRTPRQANRILAYILTWQDYNWRKFDPLINKIESKNKYKDIEKIKAIGSIHVMNIYLSMLACIKVLYPNELSWLLRRDVFKKFDRLTRIKLQAGHTESPIDFFSKFDVIESDIIEKRKIRPDVEILKVVIQRGFEDAFDIINKICMDYKNLDFDEFTKDIHEIFNTFDL